jgi:hypothetical protein
VTLSRFGHAVSWGIADEKELETGLTASKIRVFHLSAGVAQLVEHFLAKEDVARSNRVTRLLSQSHFASHRPESFKDADQI